MGMIFKLLKLSWLLFKFIAITTVLSQFVLLTAMFGKGFLTNKKIDSIRAIYAGVDYEGIRKKAILNELIQERDPYQVSKTELILTRKNAIDRRAGKVSLDEARLKIDGRRFTEVETNFSSYVDNLEKDIFEATQKQLQRVFSNMDVVQKKDTLVTMIKGGGLDTALTLVKGLNAGSQKKLFTELKTEEEKRMIGDILKQVRLGEDTEKK